MAGKAGEPGAGGAFGAGAAGVKRSAGARRTGYVAAILVNAAVFYAINALPGWKAVPFLTADAARILAFVNASLTVGILVNLVYLVAGRPAVRAAGDLLVLGIGLAAAFRVWEVFPFDFSGSPFDWALLARVLLVLGIGGSIIGIIVQLAVLVRALAG